MTLYPASIRDLLANALRALWVAATDSTRDLVCPDCRCVHREQR